MPGNPLISARNAVVALWTTNWIGTEPVLWHQNTVTNQTPDITTPAWLHIEVEHARETVVAYGGGARANERELSGVVTIRCFGLVGGGEDIMLNLLDRAVSTLRATASGTTRFFGDVSYSNARSSEDGLWSYRTAYLGYEHRFTG